MNTILKDKEQVEGIKDHIDLFIERVNALKRKIRKQLINEKKSIDEFRESCQEEKNLGIKE